MCLRNIWMVSKKESKKKILIRLVGEILKDMIFLWNEITNEFKNLSQTSWGTAMHISQRPCQIGDKPV